MGVRNKTTPKKIKTYYGLADYHGIESFICEEDFITRAMIRRLRDESLILRAKSDPNQELGEALSRLLWRARANYQRHAVVYTAKLTKVKAHTINNMLAAKKYAEALIYLKENALEIGVSKEFGQKNMWSKIPNPDLDPFRGKD